MSLGKRKYDLAIVGLGPIGVTLAMLLALDSHDVIGFDAAAEVFDRPRGIGLDQAMRIFQNLGVADKMSPFIEAYRPSEYRAADGAILRRLLPARAVSVFVAVERNIHSARTRAPATRASLRFLQS